MNSPDALEAEAIAARADNMIAAEMGDETVILDIESGQYFQLNKSAARIWGLLGEPTTIAALCAKVEAAFDVDAATCLADVKALLADMQARGLARIEAPDA